MQRNPVRALAKGLAANDFANDFALPPPRPNARVRPVREAGASARRPKPQVHHRRTRHARPKAGRSGGAAIGRGRGEREESAGQRKARRTTRPRAPRRARRNGGA